MGADDIIALPAAALARAIRAKALSPVEATRAYLERIERFDPALHAYVTVTADAALAAARAAERTLMRGGEFGPLFGVPVAVKDQFLTAGVRTTNGSRAYRDQVPAIDATVVTKLAAAGTILLGKLNMSELAFGGTREPPYGVPHNPYALDYTPGESSSGNGVALAARLCAASVGEDTGGSGRSPAAHCNAVGLRPTYSRVSRHGLMTACWFLDQAAPMTRTVEDCALILGTIAGHDPQDPTTSRRPVPDYAAQIGRDVAGMRIGVIRELHAHPEMDAEVTAAIDTAVDALRAQGASVRDVSVPLIGLSGALFIATGDTEAAAASSALLRERPDALDPASRTRMLAAALLPFDVYSRAMKARVLLRRQLLAAFADVDVMVCATSPGPAQLHDALTAPFEGGDDVRARFFVRRAYTGCFSIAAMPAISVPCGFTAAGLPIGLQIAARPFGEESIFRIAHAYEQATRWHERQPAYTTST
jgi:aspartyl-tRNA(Asn)/glutamyl-tRNA(Gln) amidotransferase subunit A